MISRIRFGTAAAVYDAFPNLRKYAPPPTGDAEPLAHADWLAAAHGFAGVAYMAHLLPRREAVWWGARCLAALLGRAAEDEAAAAAEALVRTPEEDTRRAALAAGGRAAPQSPTGLLALAAGRSGGSLAEPDQKPFLPAPDACAQLVQAAVVRALVLQSPLQMRPWARACVEAGQRFAAGGDVNVVPPAAPVRS